MKISDNLYFCEWCSEEFREKVGRHTGSKKSSATSQCICPYCGRYVSQKLRQS